MPAEIPLFAEPDARVVVFSAADLDPGAAAAAGGGRALDRRRADADAAMRHLRAAYDVRSLLCEGGPTLFGALLTSAWSTSCS